MVQTHRPLKHHEKKLLRRHDFELYKSEKTSHESQVRSQFYLQDREDYKRYNVLAGKITKLADTLKHLPPTSKVRIEVSRQLLYTLYSLGVIDRAKDLSACHRLTTASFCKRRLAVILVRLKMAPNNAIAVRFIEQGHVRVGPRIVTDPGFLVTRSNEDIITWGTGSKIREKVQKHRNAHDDYDAAA